MTAEFRDDRNDPVADECLTVGAATGIDGLEDGARPVVLQESHQVQVGAIPGCAQRNVALDMDCTVVEANRADPRPHDMIVVQRGAYVFAAGMSRTFRNA